MSPRLTQEDGTAQDNLFLKEDREGMWLVLLGTYMLECLVVVSV